MVIAVDLGRGGESVDRPGEDPVNNDHSTDSALFDVFQHRRQAVVSAVCAAGVRA